MLGRWARGPLGGREALPWLARLLAGRHEACADLLGEGTVTAAQIEELGRLHRLGPLLHARMDDSLRRAFSDRTLDDWEQAYTRRWLINEDFGRRAREFLRQPPFEEEPWLLLKGAHWALRFWGDLALREFEDLDVLVPRRDVERWLEELGRSAGGPVSAWWHRIRASVTHARSMRLPSPAAEPRLAMDLHWALRVHPSFRIDERRLWRTSETFDVSSLGRITVPSDEYALVLAVLELFDDVSRLEHSAKGLVDVLLILLELDRQLDWGEFFEVRRAEGLGKLSLDVLRSVVALFEAGEMVPSLAAALTDREAREGCRGAVPAGRTFEVLTRRTTRPRALWAHRLALFEMSRTRSLLHLGWSAPVRVVLGWSDRSGGGRVRRHVDAPPSHG